jgi:hypothetical protein
MLPAFLEVASIGLAIAVTHGALPIYLVIRKVSFVLPLFLVTVLPLSVFFSSHELTIVCTHFPTPRPSFSPFTIRIITRPLSLVAISALLKYEYSVALCLLLLQFTLIVPTLRAHETSFTVRHSLREVAIVEAAISVEQSSPSVRQAVSPFPLGIVYESFIIDSVGTRFGDSLWRFETA